MKCLFIFCDMLRPNILQTYNHKIKKKKPMDLWFEKIGGTLYTDCFTPAPDTPRSMACFYTGLYPKNNGCTLRLHWPMFYLKNVPTIFDLFKFKKYNMSMYVDVHKKKTGFIPKKNIDDLKIYHNLSLYVHMLKNQVKSEKNIFSFITLNDYHYGIDDYGNNNFGEMKAQKKLSKMFDIIFKNINKEDFDYIVIFSDHGFKFHSEIDKRSDLSLLNEDRTKVLLHVYKKGDVGFTYKNDFKTIMDIFPTFNDILKIPKFEQPKVDGISLLNNKKAFKNRFIVFEDYTIFTPQINIGHGIWGFRDNISYYYTDLYKHETNMRPVEINSILNTLKKYSVSFKNNFKLKMVRDEYDRMNSIDHPKKYSDGSHRLINKSARRILRFIGKKF